MMEEILTGMAVAFILYAAFELGRFIGRKEW